MARLDEDLQRALQEADDKIKSRTKKEAPITGHHRTIMDHGEIGEGQVPFSKVFGFLPPSGIDHALPLFTVESWHEDVREYIPRVDDGYIFPVKQTEEAVVAITRNKPLCCIGPKGSGKTSLQQQIAARLKMPWFRVNNKEGMSDSAWFGTPNLSSGNLGWNDGPLPLFGKHGGLVTGDEISAAPAGIAMALMAVLEPNGVIYVPDKPVGERYIQPHKWFRLAATDNTQLQGDTTGRYAGTNAQNEALIDRFLATVRVDYLSKEHEAKVVRSRVTNIPEDWLERMLDVAAHIRRAYDSGNLNFTLSPRGLVSWADDAVYWGDFVRAFRLSFFDKLIDDDQKQVVELFLKVTGFDINKVTTA